MTGYSAVDLVMEVNLLASIVGTQLLHVCKCPLDLRDIYSSLKWISWEFIAWISNTRTEIRPFHEYDESIELQQKCPPTDTLNF